MKIELQKWEIELLEDGDEEEKAYLEYYYKTGGGPIGLINPIGYPPGVARYGNVIGVYKTCIDKNITWQELLDYDPPEDALI